MMQEGDLQAQLHLEHWHDKAEQLQPECHWRQRRHSGSSNDDCWSVSAADEGGLYTTLIQSNVILDSRDENAMFIQHVDAVGWYPDGSKMLSGQDEKYVLSPLGNIVDEQYTVYFEFTMPTSG